MAFLFVAAQHCRKIERLAPASLMARIDETATSGHVYEVCFVHLDIATNIDDDSDDVPNDMILPPKFCYGLLFREKIPTFAPIKFDRNVCIRHIFIYFQNKSKRLRAYQVPRRD